MKLNIDFYSKEEVSIGLDFSGRYPFPDNENSELFLFACFTLRQLSNLGNHPVATALAVLLTSFNLDSAIDLAEGTYIFPERYHFFYYITAAGIELDVSKFDMVFEYIMTEFPKLVSYKGKGKKTFHVSLPPFRMHYKGFGLLGLDINYYAFHSVISLLRYFALYHENNQSFLASLSKVAQNCGKVYIAQGSQIGDQVSIANRILREIGVTPK